ncbi:hypothetical protein [Phenylobacterium sp. J367]|uniref:hypothetical protein n=1 Tax=Phenylobacterium sp. J367 TaxID=2898435 RepID=UPI00215125B5|nr:hypothetical protein [Phenylobacterium sp. J367]MCR5879012.1 hypothetical protein [Phenylobacterium sp. J367]
MFIPISGGGPAFGKADPSSLLTHVAREFAPGVARIWPAPHAPFLTASAARRQLTCLAMALGRDAAGLRDILLGDRLKRAIAAVLGAAAPAGVERALGRMGEVAWPAEAYRKLLDLLADPSAGKVLRHAPSLDADLVHRLAGLPAPMGRATHLALALNGDGVAVVREAYEALRFRDGAAAADAAAARWARTGSTTGLFEVVRDDLAPEPMAPPHPGAGRLKALATKAAMRDAARRFRNCLAGEAPHAATGWSTFYEWEGPPGAVVEITRDHVFGWRLEQARLAGNAPVPADLREAILGDLALMGVHVGRSGWELHRLLHEDVGRGYPLRPAAEAATEAFVV